MKALKDKLIKESNNDIINDFKNLHDGEDFYDCLIKLLSSKNLMNAIIDSHEDWGLNIKDLTNDRIIEYFINKFKDYWDENIDHYGGRMFK